MVGSHFAFRLRKDATSYYAVVDGVPQLLPPPDNPQYPSQFDLKGIINFKDEGMRWIRDAEFKGVNTTYSESLKFAADALEIVQQVFYLQDIEGKLQLDVWRINPSFDGYTALYEPYFVGDVDMSTFAPDVDENGLAFVSLAIKQGGLTALLKSSKTIPYEVPVSQPDTVYVQMDGLRLQGTYNWLLISSADVGATLVLNDTTFGLYAASVTGEGDFAVASQNTSTTIGMMDSISSTTLRNAAAVDNYLVEAFQSVTVQFTFNQTQHVNNPVGSGVNPKFRIDLIVEDETNTSFSYRNNFYSYTVPQIGIQSFNVSATSPQITLTENQRAYIVVYFADAPTTLLGFDQGTLSMKQEFIVNPTYTPALRYDQAWRFLVYLMSNGGYNYYSNFLSQPLLKVIDNYPYNTLLTCGNGLRDYADPRMVLTLSDMNKAGFCEWELGVGIDGDTVRVEPLSFFYNKDAEICYFEHVTGFKVIPDLSARGNVLKIGIEDQDYDSLNGKYEVNGTHVYKLPFTRVSNEIDLVSPYRSDATGIEQIRVLSSKTTTDNSADKEVVMLTVGTTYFVSNGAQSPNVPFGAKVYSLYRPNNSSNTTGVLFPDTNFNLDLTPKRKFYRNAPYIQMLNWKRDGQQIIFQTTPKNTKLVSNLGDGLITETASVDLPIVLPNNTIASPIYLPMLIQFTAIAPSNFNQLIALNPYGYIRVNWNGRDYKGFINAAGQIDAENSTFDFELQAHPDCDFSTLNYA